MKIETKFEYREYAKKERAMLDIKKISISMAKLLVSAEFYRNAKNILLFYPFGHEIDLTDLFNDDSKNWYLPRCNKENLDFYKYTKGSKLVKSSRGILEPEVFSEILDNKNADIIIIPALMADKKGYRLGYGAGFYDRFLKKLPSKTLKITSVAEKFFVDKIPTDIWDEPIDYVLTEKNLIKI
ncbi:MAG: 5-formyltetrahydrofolate cyclo-ligase [Candidatus Gastranaerophilales bacterium]|nr:5-formyltetrahydrofolate cyclo-ligase [Candidatus Gastranaerophilales bacterium]